MSFERPLRDVAQAFIDATNAFDVERALALFAPEAVIDDPSTGHVFRGLAGVRRYLERYFVGYHTRTEWLSFRLVGPSASPRGRLRVDFTGDFGHEIGLLEFALDLEGQIIRVDASLE